MGFLKPSPPRTKVEVVQSTHGQTFVTWPTDMTASGIDLPALPVGHSHPRSRHWVMADRTIVLILPGDPNTYPGGVIRHTYDVVSSTWNSRTKTLSSLVVHPSDPDVTFSVSTSGIGCACTQGPAGNAGPIGDPYEISMVNHTAPEFDWYSVVTP
jgi:hypothetical protein